MRQQMIESTITALGGGLLGGTAFLVTNAALGDKRFALLFAAMVTIGFILDGTLSGIRRAIDEGRSR